MEITLEKIELVKDRTGVSYKEAKEALEAADGNVVDAIIAIEESINQRVGAKISDNGAKVIEKIKEYVRKGNIARIIIKKEDEVVINIPVNALIIGTALAPWLTVIAAAVSFGSKCDVELIKDDGGVINISGKVEETAETVKEKGSEAFDSVRGKAQEAAEKAKAVKDTVASDAGEIKDIVIDAAQEIKETIRKEDVPETQDTQSAPEDGKQE
jgi:NACalpha-BTF3-like transcription factor